MKGLLYKRTNRKAYISFQKLVKQTGSYFVGKSVLFFPVLLLWLLGVCSWAGNRTQCVQKFYVYILINFPKPLISTNIFTLQVFVECNLLRNCLATHNMSSRKMKKNMPYAHHYKPQLVYFFTPFLNVVRAVKVDYL